MSLTWLVRWILRDLASCFLVRKLPLDDHDKASPSSHAPARNLTFDKKKDNNLNSMSQNNMSHSSKRSNKTSQFNSAMAKEKDGGVVPVRNRLDESSWSLSGDEDYIEFCFKEDKGFDVMRDDKCVKSVDDDEKHNKQRAVNRKLNYGDDEEERVSDLNTCEDRSNKSQSDIDQQYQDCINLFKEEEEEKEIGKQQQNRESNITTSTRTRAEGIEEGRMVKSESRGSDGSGGSFAFPILGCECPGSPVKMPMSGEDVGQKKQKVRSLRFQCCRF